VLVALRLSVDTAALATLADDTSDPADRQYRQFQSVATIAARYGASGSTISADERVLRADGLDLRPDATHAALWGTVTAAQVQRYFGTTLVESSGTIEPAGTPTPPAGLTGVTGIVGLTASTSVPATSVGAGSATPPCPPTVPSRSSLATLFGFTGTVAAGSTGAGTDIDIVSVHQFEPATFANYNRCAGTALDADTITQATVPGSPPTSGGLEIALDSLVLTLLAPQARLHIVNFDPSSPLAFPLLFILGEGATPNVLDLTFTYCEDQVSRADLTLSEWLLAALAATGTTTAVAAGDTGSSACYPEKSAPAVAYPASSAFVSSIGGAQYAGSASSPSHLAVWNAPGSWGGGGGTSAVIAAPPWQPGPRREVPDVAAYAVPGGAGEVPACVTPNDCQWMAEGGTSLAASVLGAAGALDAQFYGEDGAVARWGNLAGQVWRAGRSGHEVTDIVSGSNTTFTGQCCQAVAGYDTASGWGLFDPDHLRPPAG
jgi:subtilase family serine protease